MKLWRVWLLLVLGVLLPVRAALAVTMALPVTGLPGTTAALQADARHAPCLHHEGLSDDAAGSGIGDPAGHVGADPADGQRHDMPQHEGPGHDTHSAQGHSTHLLCDVCNVPALQATLALQLSPHAQPIGTPHRSERFASVVLPIGHKPPIAS